MASPQEIMNKSNEAKAFQFIEGRPSRTMSPALIDECNKENVVEHTSKPAQEIRTCQEMVRFDTSSQNDHQSSQTAPYPSTPATRMPLAELVGDGDENNKTSRPSDDISPEDQISWHAVRSPGGSQLIKTPAKQTQKRARSSSPPSSAAKRSKKAKESLDMQNLRKSLDTPQTDPAADIWQRYATTTAMHTPLPLHNPAISRVMDSSSPFAGGDNLGNVSGLRRWTSCGVEWPTSKAKRRKTRQETIQEQVEDVFAPQTKQIQGESKKIIAQGVSLLERIQESLAKPAEKISLDCEDKAPSSSSPLPGDGGFKVDRAAISPCRASELRVKLQEQDMSKVCPQEQLRNSPSSTSFGSDGICSQIMQVEDDIKRQESPKVDKVMKEEPTKNAIGAALDQQDFKPISKHLQVEVEEQDDFGEGFDFSADDFDNMIGSRHDSAVLALESKGQAKVSSTAVETDIPKSSASVDEFGDCDIDENSFAAIEAQATQTHGKKRSTKSISDRGKSTIQRYKILEMYTGLYTTDKGDQRPEKVLLVSDGKSKVNKAVTLRQSWYETRCEKGSFVHVIGAFSSDGQCLIDDTQNMLILHPDHLLSALVVADSFGCIRRAVLQDRIKATSDASPPQIYGTMLHEIFQESLSADSWDDEFLSQLIKTIISRHIEDLYEVNLNEQQVLEHLQSKIPVLRSWSEVFISAKPGPTSSINDRNGKKAHMSVNKLLDIEEHIWSPMYGLKGNIDATVQVAMKDEGGERTLTVPFEIKTGMNSTNASHRAQTALYTLLLSDRYDVAVAYGILYYMEKSEISRIPAIRHEIRHMIMQRNELACSMIQKESLPPMLKNPHTCNRCYAKTPCFLYHKLTESGDGETSGLHDSFEELVRHLQPAHQTFFGHWDSLLTKEESEIIKFRRELWTMLSTEREQLGRCFAHVSLVPGSESEDQGNSKINRFRYVFKKFEELPNFSFTASQITTGEPIVISDEKGHYALAKGYVTSVTKRRITVAIDRRLHNQRIKSNKFDVDKYQSFSGMTNVGGLRPSPSPSPSKRKAEPLLYRLDKDEFTNGLAAVRNNLIQVMRKDVFHAEDIRRLVVDLAPPSFRQTSTAYTLSGPLSQMSINDDQKAAIDKILSAQDYSLVLGMPGTGKTTTIAHIIRALVAKGKSVLLTSYTHTAVDNILLKIQHDNIDILRLGTLAKIHPEVQSFARLAVTPKNSIAEVAETYTKPTVVATTCLGISHPIFNSRVFDYCIVDEASQITLPVCLGPIRMARTFVLVGDHNQLPPLVQNREALSGGLDESLFRLLCKAHPEAVASLRHQYRMNEEIMSFSNHLIYKGSLVCGSAKVASRRLELPFFAEAMEQLHRSNEACEFDSCWIRRTLEPVQSPSAIFLNIDTLSKGPHETISGSRITNTTEATLTTQIARALLLSGVPASSIGIITMYRSQLALLKSQLQNLANSSSTTKAAEIEAHTADRFQGRDKEVVILSCVRSNESNSIGDLLKDWRRVNVALTRAKSKLIIIGSKSTLSRGDELLGKLVAMMEARTGGMLNLVTGSADPEQHGLSILTGLVPSSVVSPYKASSPIKSLQNTSPTRVRNTTKAAPTHGSPLGSRPVNTVAAVRKPFKVPSKIGRASPKVIMGASKKVYAQTGNAPSSSVLQDIINDVVGDDFWE